MFFQWFSGKNIQKPMVLQSSDAKTIEKPMVLNYFQCRIEKHCVFIDFSLRKSGFLRISEESIVYITSLILKINIEIASIFSGFGEIRTFGPENQKVIEKHSVLWISVSKPLKTIEQPCIFHCFFCRWKIEKLMVFQCSDAKTIEKTMVFALRM